MKKKITPNHLLNLASICIIISVVTDYYNEISFSQLLFKLSFVLLLLALQKTSLFEKKETILSQKASLIIGGLFFLSIAVGLYILGYKLFYFFIDTFSTLFN